MKIEIENKKGESTVKVTLTEKEKEFGLTPKLTQTDVFQPNKSVFPCFAWCGNFPETIIHSDGSLDTSLSIPTHTAARMLFVFLRNEYEKKVRAIHDRRDFKAVENYKFEGINEQE